LALNESRPYDHFLIRRLNAQIFKDGFNDGDQLGGTSWSK
jgi:iron complex outermembrane receptor protein